MKRPIALALAVAVFAALAACGSSGGGGDAQVADGVSADAPDSTADADVEEPAPEWHALKGTTLEGVKSVKGFGCAEGSIFLDIDGLQESGLFVKKLGEEGGFSNLFGGEGLISVIPQGVLLASFGGENQTSSVVLVDETGAANDLGFAFEQTEVRALQFVGNFVVTMSKDWAVAEYMIHRGGLTTGTFEQVGKRLNETAMSTYSTGEEVYLLTQLNEYSGTGCRQVGLTSIAEAEWAECSGFPEYVKYNESDAYSVKAAIFGEGSQLALWFRVSDKGEKSWVHYVNSAGDGWEEVAGFPNAEPSAWLHSGGDYFVGYKGVSGVKAVVQADADGANAPEFIGEGLVDASEDSGVVGFCRMGSMLYAAWLDFNLAGSSVTVLRVSID